MRKTPSMSALGQKQTCAVQLAMSAFPPIATVKADIRKRSCLLYPQKQTCALHQGMSALGQKRAHAARGSLFDQLVGAGDHCGWHCKAKRFGRLEIDHQLLLGRRLNREVGWLLGPLECDQ